MDNTQYWIIQILVNSGPNKNSIHHFELQLYFYVQNILICAICLIKATTGHLKI